MVLSQEACPKPSAIIPRNRAVRSRGMEPPFRTGTNCASLPVYTMLLSQPGRVIYQDSHKYPLHYDFATTRAVLFAHSLGIASRAELIACYSKRTSPIRPGRSWRPRRPPGLPCPSWTAPRQGVSASTKSDRTENPPRDERQSPGSAWWRITWDGTAARRGARNCLLSLETRQSYLSPSSFKEKA